MDAGVRNVSNSQGLQGFLGPYLTFDNGLLMFMSDSVFVDQIESSQFMMGSFGYMII